VTLGFLTEAEQTVDQALALLCQASSSRYSYTLEGLKAIIRYFNEDEESAVITLR
jgi:hypothetical protein